MTDEDTNVVQPGRGIERIVIEGSVLREFSRQFVEPRLMAELIRRNCVRANVLGNGVAIGLIHGVKIFIETSPELPLPQRGIRTCHALRPPAGWMKNKYKFPAPQCDREP